jgi:O-antigen/teichoic acid export membrane protein
MRLIPPNEFGRIALFSSFLIIVTPVISVSADGLIAINKSKFDLSKYEHFRKNYVSLAYLIYFVIQSSFLSIFFLGTSREIFLILVPLSSLLKFLINLASMEYVMEGKSVQYGMVQFFTNTFSLVLTIVFIYLFSPTAVWRLTALILADLVFLLVRYHGRMNLLISFVFDKLQYREIVKFGFPLMLSIAPAWALNEADKVIVAKHADLTSVGIYAAACTIGAFMVTFNSSLLNAILPKLYAELSMQQLSILSITKRYLWKYVLISAIFAAFFTFVYGIMADMILPAKYVAARNVVYWVVFFALARSFYSIIGTVTDYFGMTMERLKGIVLGGAAALLSIYIGVLHFGISGATLGVGVGYSVLGITLWFYLVQKEREMNSKSLIHGE